jgi:hypothetical protein
MATTNFNTIRFYEAKDYNYQIARTRKGTVAGQSPVNEFVLKRTGTGNVTCTSASTTLSGASSAFGTDNIGAGYYIDTNEATPRRIGVVASVTNDSTIVLVTAASFTYTGGFLIRQPIWSDRLGAFLVAITAEGINVPVISALRTPQGCT